jgi:hypothetical protein
MHKPLHSPDCTLQPSLRYVGLLEDLLAAELSSHIALADCSVPIVVVPVTNAATARVTNVAANVLFINATVYSILRSYVLYDLYSD